MLRAATIIFAIMLAAGCATTGEEPAVAAAREKPPAKPAFRQSDIAGKDAAALDRLLGAPALIRKEGAGEFRRYAFKSCSLIVILYPDDKGALAAQKVDAAAKVAGEPRPDLDLCLAKGLAAAAIS
jgi:hypothetical protein